ncbi:hypothetical protein B0H17DRAFT_1126494 [Mycena rosella]|uniref:Uncharacterized protein n=1 Tax=Mycena rosella TaxID=1033263 RepID=A0AAD7GTN1_MYCRO|nr:hypothetical protein B0H17DRAFT_1126494 [Mycena rosella]
MPPVHLKQPRSPVVPPNPSFSMNSLLVVPCHSIKNPETRSFKLAGTENKPAARTACIEKTNFLTMNFLCDTDVAPAVVNNCSFRTLLNHPESENGVKVTSTSSSNYIPAEAARVMLLAIEELKKHSNLTLGYDGSTTLKQQSIYTFYVTTPDHEVYFIKGDKASVKG